MNQRDFSKKLGISQASYSMIESGVNSLSNKHIKLICATFSVSENWIRTGEGNMFLSSPYDKELMIIFGNLTNQSKSYLLSVANGLLELQKSFISSKDEYSFKSKGQFCLVFFAVLNTLKYALPNNFIVCLQNLIVAFLLLLSSFKFSYIICKNKKPQTFLVNVRSI